MSLRIHKQLEEDCLVHKKARTNSEVEITVLKNRLKRNERNYQSELEAAIRSREELERILADDAGKDVARKLNEMVIQSSNEIQARKDAELAQLKMHQMHSTGKKEGANDPRLGLGELPKARHAMPKRLLKQALCRRPRSSSPVSTWLTDGSWRGRRAQPHGRLGRKTNTIPQKEAHLGCGGAKDQRRGTS